MPIVIDEGVSIHDDLLEAIKMAAYWPTYLQKHQGNCQMYREQLTQRLYRQLRNNGMTKPEAAAAIELGTGEKPLPVATTAAPSMWATYSNKELAMQSMPSYHQLKRRRF